MLLTLLNYWHFGLADSFLMGHTAYCRMFSRCYPLSSRCNKDQMSPTSIYCQIPEKTGSNGKTSFFTPQLRTTALKDWDFSSGSRNWKIIPWKLIWAEVQHWETIWHMSSGKPPATTEDTVYEENNKDTESLGVFTARLNVDLM